jgi:hypothetical protein
MSRERKTGQQYAQMSRASARAVSAGFGQARVADAPERASGSLERRRFGVRPHDRLLPRVHDLHVRGPPREPCVVVRLILCQQAGSAPKLAI